MAPKQAEENPHMASSSEEEEESESTREEDSKRDESSDDEGDDQLTSAVPVAAKSDSEDESDSDSDSEPLRNTSVSMTTTKSKSSTGKRSLKQTDDVEVKKKKKMKTGDEAKLMFQRLFSETDEMALLQGILDFTSTSTRGDFHKEMDAFVAYVKKLINFDASKSQIVTKIQRLKKKFSNIVKNSLKKGKSEEEIVFSKDLDQKAFELSRKIWGENGVLASKSRMKVEESPNGTAEANANVVDASLTPVREILAYFFKTENVSAYGLDESALIAGWDMVADGSKKREMEKKLKLLKAVQVELCMQRTGLVAESAKLIFKDSASSSGR